MTNEKLKRAKRMAASGGLAEARRMLETDISSGATSIDLYQYLLDVLAYQGDIDACLDTYTKGLDAGFSTLALNQFFFNVVPKIKDRAVSIRTIARLETILGKYSNTNIFTILALSSLYANVGNVDRSIELNQKYFSPNVKRPSQTLRPPNFVVLGTVKGGTTSFYDYLILHPKIKSALFKELRYFNIPKNFGYGKFWYYSNFPQNAGFISGEATPGYFSSPQCPARIKEALPDAKLFICLREPAARAISHYHMDLREGRVSGSLSEIINECEKIQPSANIDPQKISSIPDCIADSFYVYHLSNWLKYFDRKQIHIVQSHHLASAPGRVMNEAFGFLGVEPFELPKEVTSNRGEYEEESEVRARLSAYLKPFNEGLDDLLGCHFDWK